MSCAHFVSTLYKLSFGVSQPSLALRFLVAVIGDELKEAALKEDGQLFLMSYVVHVNLFACVSISS